MYRPLIWGHFLLRHLQDQTTIPDDEVDEVIVGNLGNPVKYPNIGRVIALEAGLDKKVPGYTVQRNCASGMQALAEGFLNITCGRSHVVFAGGVESMSQIPLLYGKEMTKFFIEMTKAKSMREKWNQLKRFRISHLNPVIALEKALTDPFCGMNMGMTAELLSRELGISREEQDKFANNSHMKAVAAQEKQIFDDEILPVITGEKLDKLVSVDSGPRKDSSIKSLARMSPYFDKKSGTVTIGNSCPITDGGSLWLMASEEAVTKYNLNPMARMVDFHFHGLDPRYMGIGPFPAMNGVLKRVQMKLSQIDLLEINEAFAAQVLAVIKACVDKKTANLFGMEPIGEILHDKLNVNGGAIALGHPVGSTGSRMIVTLAPRIEKKWEKIWYGQYVYRWRSRRGHHH